MCERLTKIPSSSTRRHTLGYAHTTHDTAHTRTDFDCGGARSNDEPAPLSCSVWAMMMIPSPPPDGRRRHTTARVRGKDREARGASHLISDGACPLCPAWIRRSKVGITGRKDPLPTWGLSWPHIQGRVGSLTRRFSIDSTRPWRRRPIWRSSCGRETEAWIRTGRPLLRTARKGQGARRVAPNRWPTALLVESGGRWCGWWARLGSTERLGRPQFYGRAAPQHTPASNQRVYASMSSAPG